MKPEPQFKAFPLASAPLYTRWWTAGAVLLALVGGGGVLLRPFLEARVAALLGASLLLLWLLLLLARTLYYRLNRHLAQAYDEEVQCQQRRWWAWHRQQVALSEALLLGPLGSEDGQWRRVLAGKEAPPQAVAVGAGQALRLLQVFGSEPAERELQLARLLVQSWRVQRGAEPVPQPWRCYWQGSAEAWLAFREQMALDFPDLELPVQPEPWQGIASLEAIIDGLRSAADDACVLCAGSQSSVPTREARLPAGEAAVLWLLGKDGEVRLARGEWLAADQDEPAAVAQRAQRQSRLDEPPEACVGFTPREDVPMEGFEWNLSQYRQDDYWGELQGLQPLVALTLAACLARQHGNPCAWLAADPQHSLALGIVSVDDASS